MSKVQRWDTEFYDGAYGKTFESSDGDYILHADIVKIFEWMVSHSVEFQGPTFWWYDFVMDGWKRQRVPDGDYLAAIAGLMGGEE